MTTATNPIRELAELHRRIAEVYAEMAGTPAPAPVTPPGPREPAPWRCPEHPDRDPKESKNGGLYCTARIGTVTGKPVYCDQVEPMARAA